VSKILDVKLDTENSKAAPLQFLVRWAAPWQDPSNDTWEPYSNLNKLTAMQHFLKSHAFSKFAATKAYKAYVAAIPAKQRAETVPRVVMFLC
jgi:hypothetical protein